VHVDAETAGTPASDDSGTDCGVISGALVPRSRRPIAPPGGGVASRRARSRAAWKVAVVPVDDEQSGEDQPPAWALDEATRDLSDQQDQDAVVNHARDLAREAEARDTRPRDDFDDPDQGGEG
jgi:hypothetical protein